MRSRSTNSPSVRPERSSRSPTRTRTVSLLGGIGSTEPPPHRRFCRVLPRPEQIAAGPCCDGSLTVLAASVVDPSCVKIFVGWTRAASPFRLRRTDPTAPTVRLNFPRGVRDAHRRTARSVQIFRRESWGCVAFLIWQGQRERVRGYAGASRSCRRRAAAGRVISGCWRCCWIRPPPRRAA
jgi:hypothetical protein